MSGQILLNGVDLTTLQSLTPTELIAQIRQRIQELEAFCQALSEAIYVAPDVTFTAPAPSPG